MTRYIPSNPFAKAGLILLIGAGVIYLMTVLNRPRPHEANRVVSRTAFSIIRPDGWSADMRHAQLGGAGGKNQIRDFIEMSPDRYIGIAPSIYARRYALRPDLDGLRTHDWSDGEFQGEKALVLAKQVKRRFYREAIFERAGQWFEVGETLPNAEAMRSDEWWRFLETFRYPEPGVTPPQDVPTTGSTTGPSTEPFVLPQFDQ